MKAIHLPEEKLNELALEVSESLLAHHTFADGVIRGEELTAFTEHEQINKFLLFQVYQIWNMQISKLKHPYFDFEQPEIEEALKQLRNLLSRHIRIAKADFHPLLQRAVYNNLKLLLDPHEAFSSFFFVNGNQTSVDLFGRYVPFFSDLDFVVNSILKYCQKNEYTAVEKDTFFEKMDRVFALYSQKSGQHINDYRNDILRKLTGKDLAELEGIALAEQQRLEAARQQEAEAARLAEQAARQQEESARLEAERQKAEAEARRQAEEAHRQAEEARRQKEEALRKASLFDALATAPATDVFDIEEEEITEDTGAPVEPYVDPAPLVKEPTTFDLDDLDDEAVEETPPIIAAVEQEVIVSEPEPEVIAEPEPEVIAEPEPEVVAQTTVEMEEETTVSETIISEAPIEEVVVAETTIEEAIESIVETKEAALADAAEENADEFLEMAASMEPEPEPLNLPEEKPKTILDSFRSKQVENGAHNTPSILDKAKPAEPVENKESTVSFLDRFLNQKDEAAPVAEEKTARPILTPQSPEPPRKEEEPVVLPHEEVPTAEERFPEPEGKDVQPQPEPEPQPKEEPEITIPPSVVSAAESSSWKIEEEEKPASILDKLQSSSQTIADRFAPSPSVGTSVNGNRKIQLDEIPIHKQYQYVQKVFDGNNVRFRVIVEKVNNAANKLEVEDLVKKYILNNDGLNPDDAVVSEFIALLRNRF